MLAHMYILVVNVTLNHYTYVPLVSILRLLSMIVDWQDCSMNEDVPGRTVCGILKQILLSLSELVNLYSDLPSFSEVFAPVFSNLQQ